MDIGLSLSLYCDCWRQLNAEWLNTEYSIINEFALYSTNGNGNRIFNERSD